MSKLNLYCYFDSKVKAFSPPFSHRNHGDAIRTFGDRCMDTSMIFGLHPEDFSLMHVGEFDDETGAVSRNDAPINLGLGASFKPDLKPVKGA